MKNLEEEVIEFRENLIEIKGLTCALEETKKSSDNNNKKLKESLLNFGNTVDDLKELKKKIEDAQDESNKPILEELNKINKNINKINESVNEVKKETELTIKFNWVVISLLICNLLILFINLIVK